MISSARLAELPTSLEGLRRAKPRAFRPRKCSESGSSVMMKGCRAFLIAGSENHGAAVKNVAAARNNDGATKNKRARRGPAQKARKFNARKISPNLDSSSKTDLETCGKHRELKRKCARRLGAKRAPGRNRARDHPLQRRTQDH